MKAKLTFLGTGTSQGVPMIGCKCDVCSSMDPRDKRLRASAIVEYGGVTILVDCGPDFRQEMIREGVSHLDAVLLTHNHKDHTGGLDDLRSFNLLESKPVNIWCEPYVLESLKKEYSYAFAEPRYPGSPEWRVHTIGEEPFTVFSNDCEDKLVWESGFGYHIYPQKQTEAIKKVEVVPIHGWHNEQHTLSVMGYRFGNIAYLTDMKEISSEGMERLKGVEYVTINCVKRTPHFSHLSLSQALEFFEKVGAKESYITHISHLLPRHEVLEKELPDHVHLAYDGLIIQ